MTASEASETSVSGYGDLFEADIPVKPQAVETAFQEDFHKSLVSDRPLYDAFAEMAMRRLPQDAKARYERLRSSGFVMTDEADIDVYTQHVAGRHIPKFKWLYANLFQQYRAIFTSPIGIIVWGCGCGLDLIALYDQAMKEGNPNFWLIVRSITLIDISEPAMKRAQEIAELLFPMAEIKRIQVNLKNQDDVRGKVKFDALFPYTTRVHLLSNVIDLFDDVTPFSESVKSVSSRAVQSPKSGEKPEKKMRMHNEMFIAFSPDYKVGEVKRNLARFRECWGKCADDIALMGDAPMNCEYAAFVCNSLRESFAYKMFVDGNQFLRRLVKSLPGSSDDGTIMLLMRTLTEFEIGGKPFPEQYEFLEMFDVSVKISPKDGKGTISESRKGFFCVAGIGQLRKPFVVLLDGKPEEKDVCRIAERVLGAMEEHVLDDEAAKAMERLHDEYNKQRAARKEKQRPEEVDSNIFDNDRYLQALRKELINFLLFAYWDQNNKTLCSLEGCAVAECHAYEELSANADYSKHFVIAPGAVEVLPPLSNEQREIANGRKQMRKIKGGPGVGKTVTMLWHALLAVQRTHMPVLILCKTVSLIHYNERRLVATYLADHPDQDGIDRDLICFKTIDAFLCDYQKKRAGCCILSKCGKCTANCARLKVLEHSAKNVSVEDRKRDMEIRGVFACESCGRKADKKEVCKKIGCKGLDAAALRGRKVMTNEFMENSCRDCKAEIVMELKSKDKKRAWKEEFGAVLVDEAQIADPEHIKSVYNLTAAGNRWREFYMFCDAQQAFRHNTIEQDTQTKKWDVKVPDIGFGRFCVLKENYRMKSRALIEACRIIQGKLRGRDEGLTLFDWTKLGKNPDVGTGAFGIRSFKTVNYDFVEKEAVFLHDKCGAESVTVICEEQSMTRRLAKTALEKEWIVTHLAKADYAKEKKLRAEFFEHTGCNHLTSVDCAQGQSFEAVIFILSSNREQFDEGMLEQVFTALSRSGRYLRVLDASPKHWLYDLLKGGK